MVLGSAKFGEAALFLSIVGSANFVFVSCVPIILYFTRVEYIGSPADIPWTYLCGVAGLLFGTKSTTGHCHRNTSIVTIILIEHASRCYSDFCCFLFAAFNVLMNFGIAITYPTFISLGVVLSVPVNASKPLSPCGPNFLMQVKLNISWHLSLIKCGHSYLIRNMI